MDSRENLLFRCMRYLKELKEFEDGFQEVLDRAPCGYDLHGRSFVDMSLVKLMMELLEKLYLDYERWINYWVYDLDFGKNWKPGELIDSDGSDTVSADVLFCGDHLYADVLYPVHRIADLYGPADKAEQPRPAGALCITGEQSVDRRQEHLCPDDGYQRFQKDQ